MRRVITTAVAVGAAVVVGERLCRTDSGRRLLVTAATYCKRIKIAGTTITLPSIGDSWRSSSSSRSVRPLWDTDDEYSDVD